MQSVMCSFTCEMYIMMNDDIQTSNHEERGTSQSREKALEKAHLSTHIFLMYEYVAHVRISCCSPRSPFTVKFTRIDRPNRHRTFGVFTLDHFETEEWSQLSISFGGIDSSLRSFYDHSSCVDNNHPDHQYGPDATSDTLHIL